MLQTYIQGKKKPRNGRNHIFVIFQVAPGSSSQKKQPEVDKPENPGAGQTEKSAAAPPRGSDRAAQNGLNAFSLTLADFDVGLGEGAGRQQRSSQQHAHGTAAAHRRSSTVLSSGRGRRRHWGQLRPHPRQEAAPHLLVLPSSPSRAGMRLPAGLRSRTAPPCAVRRGLAVSAPGAQRGRQWPYRPERGCFVRSAAHLPGRRRARAVLQREETSSIKQKCDGCSRMSPFRSQNCVWK